MTKHRLDRLASKIWYQAVELGLGLSSPIAVELLLEGDRVKPDSDGIKRPRKWRNFCDGKRTPSDNPGALNVFDIAECHAPGTARWFRSPLWKALKGQFEHPDDLLELLCELPAIQGVIFPGSEHLEYDIPTENGHHALTGIAPLRKFEVDRIGECVGLDGLDLLEAIVLLLEYGQSTRNQSITSRSLDLYRAASPKICKIAELRYSFELLFEELEGRYTCFADVPPDEIFPPWHVRMPQLTQQIYDIDILRAAAFTTTAEKNGTYIGAISMK